MRKHLLAHCKLLTNQKDNAPIKQLMAWCFEERHCYSAISGVETLGHYKNIVVIAKCV